MFRCLPMSEVLNSGIPEGTAATTSLPDDAWDLLGLGVTDGLNDRELHIKNGQVCLLTGGDYMSAKRRYALENREAHRAQWRQQAEQRLAKVSCESNRHDVPWHAIMCYIFATYLLHICNWSVEKIFQLERFWFLKSVESHFVLLPRFHLPHLPHPLPFRSLYRFCLWTE